MQKTSNYNLPIFEQGESPAWVGDWNAAMQIIDANMGGGGSSDVPVTDVTGKMALQYTHQTASTYSTGDEVDGDLVFTDTSTPSYFIVELSIHPLSSSVNTFGFGGLLLSIRDNGTNGAVLPPSYFQAISSGKMNTTCKQSFVTPLLTCDDGLKFRYTLYGDDYTNFSISLDVKQYRLTDYV